MSRIKRHMEEQEARRQEALDVCISAGTIEECEFHDGIYFSGETEVEEAYKLANSRITKGEITLSDGMTRKDFTDIVKSVHDDNSASYNCSICEKAGL